MGGGKQNNNQDIMPPAIKEEEDEDVVAEIAAKKNRERFAINKSYSIEVSIPSHSVVISEIYSHAFLAKIS